jgi:hypothetical protein
MSIGLSHRRGKVARPADDQWLTHLPADSAMQRSRRSWLTTVGIKVNGAWIQEPASLDQRHVSVLGSLDIRQLLVGLAYGSGPARLGRGAAVLAREPAAHPL